MSGYEEAERLKPKRGLPANKVDYAGVPTIEYDDGRDEKPWQRVVYEVTRKGTHLYEPVKSVPSYLIIILLGVYLLLGFLTQLVEDGMPRVVQDGEVARDNTNTFSEEAAWRYLNVIIGDEPRVAGTVYHYNKTRDMKSLVDSIALQANQPIRTDWQTATGNYLLNMSVPFINFYQDASNVIVLLEGESGFHSNGTIASSVLVNCHYDSVPYALGASDNAVFCAVMAETLSRLSRRTTKFKHNIVFLFNGAEENPLQASHAFLQHPWSRGIVSVVNLDAAGMNGKATVFQVTDRRSLSAYKRAVYRPNAQSLGEFMFTSGIIPSDTDFRIWRDFGNFHGIDIAFAKWGHVYHTRYDHPSLIRTGVLQCAGDMLIGLVSEIADIQGLENTSEPSSAVYYDYLNLFLVMYSIPAAYAVDVMVAVFGLLTVAYYVWLVGPRLSTLQELLYCTLGRLAAMLAGIIVVAIFVPIMIGTTVQLRYLTEPWLVVPLYWMPYLITAVGVSQLYDAWRTKKSGLNRSIRTLQAMSATRLLLAVSLLIATCIPFLTSARYIITVPLFIMSLMALVSLTVVRYVRLTGWQHLLLEAVLSLPSAMLMMAMCLRMDALLLPVMGRSHTDTPDYTVAIVNVGLAILVAATVSGIELLFSRRHLWMAGAVLAVTCIVLMFIPFSPYQDEGPSTQRHYWFHTEIVSYDTNNLVTSRTTGVVVTKHDAYSISRVLPALQANGIQLSSRTNFTSDCETHVHCNLPLYRASFGPYLKESLFLYTGGPSAFAPTPSLSLNNRVCNGQTCILTFTMIGAPHNMITIWPRAGVTLSSWSLSAPLQAGFQHNGRPVYLIVHSRATYNDVQVPVIFTLTFTIPTTLQSEPIVDISHNAHKIHHPQDYTSEYRQILAATPKYFNIANFQTIRSNYIF